MGINDRLLNRAARRAVMVERAKAGAVSDAVGTYNRFVADRVEELALKRLDKLKSRGRKGLRSETFKSALQDIGAVIAAGTDRLRIAIAADLVEFSLDEAGWQARMIVEELPAELRRRLRVRRPSRAFLEAIKTARPLQGRHLREWAQDLDRDTRRAVAQAMRQGMVAGESGSEVVRRLRGTAAAKFRDGVLNRPRHEIARVVRTAGTHVANRAREAVATQNQDLVKGVQWLSVLDARTSLICLGLHGEIWPVGRGDRPPAHPNCRSTTVLVLKSFQELGFDVNELQPGTIATMDGQRPADITGDQWLHSKGAAFQDRLIGPARAKLFRSGTVTLDRLVDKRLRVKDLEQLDRELSLLDR